MKTALLIIDTQKDFIDGKLSIPYSGSIVKRILNITPEFDFVFSIINHNKIEGKPKTEDIKISDTNSYCIDDEGIKIDEKIGDKFPIFIRSYSDGFSGLLAKKDDKNILTVLKENDITDVFLCGLPGDYPVKYTALDCVKNKFKTHLIIDGIKTIGKMEDLLKNIIQQDINIISSNDIKFFISVKKNPEEFLVSKLKTNN